MEASKIWDECLAFIRSNTSEEVYETWFKPIKAISLQDKTLKIEVPTQLYYEWLETHFVDLLRAALTKVLGRNAKLIYAVRMSKTDDQAKINYPGASKPKINTVNPKSRIIKDINPFVIPGVEKVTIDSNLNPNYTFDNFIEGPNNKLARNAGMAIAKRVNEVAFNPLFIFGGVGLGKTHLANAVGVEIKRLHPGKNVLYVSMEKFSQQYASATINNTRNDFLQFYQMMDVLIVDDVQFLAGKEGAQKAFFQIFNHLHQNKKILIFTSDKAPVEIKDIKGRLLSRFKWGLAAELKAPNYETRVRIIKAKLFADGMEMPEDVIHYIAQNVRSNIREIEGILTSLIAQATYMHREINLDLAQEVIDKIVRHQKPHFSCEMIKQHVAKFFNIDVSLLDTKRRKRQIVMARQVAMYLAKKFTKAPLEQIGREIGNKDHATVIYSLKVVNDLMDTDKKFRKFVDEIENGLYNL